MNSLLVSFVPWRARRPCLDLHPPAPRPAARRATWLWPAMLSLLLALAGCAPPAATIRVEIKPDYAKFPKTEPIPMTVGVFHSWEFLTFQYRRYFQRSPVVAPVGQASVEMFGRLLEAGFGKTVPVYVLPSGGQAVDGVDAIIETRVEAFDFLVGFNKPSDNQRIVYRLILYTPRGVPVHTWTVEGAYRLAEGEVRQHVSEDLEIAGARFLSGLREEIEKARPRLRAEASHKTHGEMEAAGFKAAVNEHPPGFSDEEAKVLLTGRYVPVTLSVRNPYPVPIEFRTDQMTLYLPDGQRLTPIPPDLLLAGLDTERSSGLAAGMAFGTFGMLGAMAAEEEKAGEERAKRRQALLDSATWTQTLQPDQAAELQAFYRLPEGDRPSAALLAGWSTERSGQEVHPWSTGLVPIPPPPPPPPPPGAQATSRPGANAETSSRRPDDTATAGASDAVPVFRRPQSPRSVALFPIYGRGCIHDSDTTFCGGAIKTKAVAGSVTAGLTSSPRVHLKYTAHPMDSSKSPLGTAEVNGKSWNGFVDKEADRAYIRGKCAELGADVAVAVSYSYDYTVTTVHLYLVSATGRLATLRIAEIPRGKSELQALERLVRTAVEEYLVFN